MISIATFSLLFIAVSAQQYQPQNYAGQGYQSTTPAPIVHPAAQVHYVNIGQDLAGDYKFGYDTGKGPLGQSFREESRLPDGTVKGAYGYVDSAGLQRIVRYTAGKLGFMIDGDEPAAGGAAAAAPAAARPAPQPARAPTPSYQTYPAAPQTRFQHPPAPANFAAPPAAAAAPQPQAYNQAYNPAPQAAPLQLPALPQGNAALQYRYAQAAGASQPQANPALAYNNYNPQPQYRSAPAAAPAPLQAPPSYSSQGIANSLSPSNPLSSFPQLPGVRLIQINPRQQAPQQASYGAAQAQPAAASYNLAAQNSFNSQPGQASTPAPEEYNGPVIINAALLSYDIGSGRRQQA